MAVSGLGSLHTHTRSCGYTTVSCPNHCDRLQSSLKLLQKDLATHQEVCPARTHQCPHCSIMGPYQELTTSHLDTCPKVEVHCPYPTCNETTQRCYLDIHRATCQNIPYPCKYANVGCPAQLKLAELQGHEEDNQLHLQITKEKVMEMTELLQVRERRFREHTEQMNKEIAILKQKLPALIENGTRPTIFKLQGFDTYKLQGKVFRSPPFYLDTGYSFQTKIFANGRGRGANTHLSLFLYLAKGCNDDLLPWPFDGTIKVEILNQLKDKDHLSEEIKFTRDCEISGRVMNRSRQLRGWGKEQFVSNKELANVSSKRQYLKCDTLYFRVSVCTIK